MITPEQQGEPAEIRAVGHGVATESERQAQRTRLLRVRGRHRAVPHRSGCFRAERQDQHRGRADDTGHNDRDERTQRTPAARGGGRARTRGSPIWKPAARVADEAARVPVRAEYRRAPSAAGRVRGSRRRAPPRVHGAGPRPDPRRPAGRRSGLPPRRRSASAAWRRPRWSAPACTPSAPLPLVRHRHFAPIHQRCATPPRPPPDGGRSAEPRASARIRPRPIRGVRAPALRPRPQRLRSTGAPPAVASPPAHRSGPPPARARHIRRPAPRMPGRPTPGGDCTAYCGANDRADSSSASGHRKAIKLALDWGPGG